MLAEIQSIQEELNQKWLVFWWALPVSILAIAVAWSKRFFRPIHFNESPMIHGKDVLRGFGYFLFVELLLVPTLVGLALIFMKFDIETTIFTSHMKSWINFFIILGGFAAAFTAYLELKPIQKSQLWGPRDQLFQNLKMGIFSWFLSFPIVLFFSQGVSLALWHFFHHPFVEQVAVQNIRNSMESPFLFISTALSIFTLVPFTEEFLFRGLLQSWLKQKFHRPSLAIFFSSLVFTLFHYSSSHGLSNIELLSSLFLLSCMLGYLFERQHSLWAPIGLHGFFNLISVLMI